MREPEAYFAHESAYIDQPCSIGKGTKIWHFCHIMSDTRIGERCNLGQNVVVSPGCVIGNLFLLKYNVSIYTGVTLEDDVFCGPSMVFTNVINPRSHVPRKDEYKPTLVRRGASIGANATIVCGVTLGRYCFIGAGAVVTRDVPDYAMMVGSPARVRGWMCYCGVKLGLTPTGQSPETAACDACGRRYRRDGLVVAELDGQAAATGR
jgi:UDP-2-acetamido-3-amino-2,3-dideoxy-glucuronate N-acetyltransferase